MLFISLSISIQYVQKYTELLTVEKKYNNPITLGQRYAVGLVSAALLAGVTTNHWPISLSCVVVSPLFSLIFLGNGLSSVGNFIRLYKERVIVVYKVKKQYFSFGESGSVITPCTILTVSSKQMRVQQSQTHIHNTLLELVLRLTFEYLIAVVL